MSVEIEVVEEEVENRTIIIWPDYPGQPLEIAFAEKKEYVFPGDDVPF